MVKEKDSRITGRYTSFKEYIVLLFILAGFNGFHMWIYQTMYRNGIAEENISTVINILMVYVMVMAAIATLIIGLIRYRFFINPTRKLSEAAGKIAKGDFTIRIPSSRGGEKKNFIDVLYDDFNTMAEELASIETLKNDFIANVSHEIKTPLSVIQTYTIALQNKNISEEERGENIKTILEATQKLSALVTNILKLSKLENQEITRESKYFDLSEQLRRCALMFADNMERKNIQFEEDIDDISVCYDENLLEIVWNNLISNAVKFTDTGGVIHISLKNVSASKQDFIHISVADTGCGINETAIKHIFDKFYQGDTSHSGSGNGLGLALVKKTVDLLGGTVTAESVPGKGSKFTVILQKKLSAAF